MDKVITESRLQRTNSSPSDKKANERASSSECPKLRVCIDVDMSFRPFGLHIGTHRSPVRSMEQFKQLVDAVQASQSLTLVGVMGYEVRPP
jgi:D-serine deaminase-like pyridoxal phosphate-dependent protein